MTKGRGRLLSKTPDSVRIVFISNKQDSRLRKLDLSFNHSRHETSVINTIRFLESTYTNH
jgi:hypothetical protein